MRESRRTSLTFSDPSRHRSAVREAACCGHLDRYLKVLETSGTTGSREPVMPYELFRMKGLNDRAARFRRETEQKYAVYNISQFFDKVDAQYATPFPGK